MYAGAAAGARPPAAAPRSILGDWFAARPGARERVVLATKVAGPSRNMDWVRNGSRNLTAAEIVQACDDSLRRLRTDRIDLYQIHWPNRNVPIFGSVYYLADSPPKLDADYSPVAEQRLRARWPAWSGPARCARSACRN